MEIKISILCIYFLFIVAKTLFLCGVVSSVSVQVNFSSNEQGLPNNINVTLTTATNSSTEFRMIRVDYVKLPIYSIETGKGGQNINKENVDINENVAFYQDTNKGAVFQLSRVDAGQLDEFIITRGQYRKGNGTYSIQPTLKMRSKREATQNDTQSDLIIYEIRNVSAPPITMSDSLNPPPEHHSSIPTNKDSPFSFGSKFKRRRRQAFSNYYIDVTAFLDSTNYNRFLREAFYDSSAALSKIREYYTFIFTGIDLVYQNFKSTRFQLRVRLTKIVIFKSTVDFPLSCFTICYYNIYCYTSNYVNTMNVLSDFSTFLNSAKRKDLVFPYDNAMLFVGAANCMQWVITNYEKKSSVTPETTKHCLDNYLLFKPR